MASPNSIPKEFPVLPQVALLNGPDNGSPVLGSDISKVERAIRWITGWQLPVIPTILTDTPIDTTKRVYTIAIPVPSVKCRLRVGIKTRHVQDPETDEYAYISTGYVLASGSTITPLRYTQALIRGAQDVVFEDYDGYTPATPSFDTLELSMWADRDGVARLSSISIMWLPLYPPTGPGVV